jgi:hypothetical protein
MRGRNSSVRLHLLCNRIQSIQHETGIFDSLMLPAGAVNFIEPLLEAGKKGLNATAFYGPVEF